LRDVNAVDQPIDDDEAIVAESVPRTGVELDHAGQSSPSV
jgi:hypothetical protein